ncbi:MAG: ImmA/IrrE family metallo-endopeptidase [Desulfosporosinus sp.]|nr:ImmA/IrrE family metallo-endopeptidase [Desulfosporosinus sp.]
MIDKMALSNKASSVRKKLGEDNTSPIDIFALMYTTENVTLVKYPLGEKISGACLKNNTSAVIAVNSSMSIGRQRFSLAHELYHLYFDENMISTICPSKIGGGNQTEKSADQFASYLLMPPAALYEKIQEMKSAENRKLTVKDVIKLEQYFGVSRKAMLFRLQEEGELSQSDAADMQKDVIISAAKLGYDTSLYKPTPENENKGTYGYYIKQAENLLQSDIISTGKYEEWLLDAFRDDIVYGDDMEGGELID